MADGKADAGLIIHEGQLTYQNQKLHCVIDLGVWWKELTGLPLPLGGNAHPPRSRRAEHARDRRIIKGSIQYSLDHRDEAVRHAMQYARDNEPVVADRFVGMYVNQ